MFYIIEHDLIYGTFLWLSLCGVFSFEESKFETEMPDYEIYRPYQSLAVVQTIGLHCMLPWVNM